MNTSEPMSIVSKYYAAPIFVINLQIKLRLITEHKLEVHSNFRNVVPSYFSHYKQID